MKRTAIAILAAFLTLAALAGCSGGKNAASTTAPVTQQPAATPEPAAEPSPETVEAAETAAAPESESTPAENQFPVDYTAFGLNYTITGYAVGMAEDRTVTITLFGDGYGDVSFNNGQFNIPALCSYDAADGAHDAISCEYGASITFSYDSGVAPAVITITNNDTGETILSFDVTDAPAMTPPDLPAPQPTSAPTPEPTPETVSVYGTDYDVTETFLSLPSDGITDATPVTKLVNLNHLDLSGNAITDVTPLAELTALTFLDLSDNNISDVSALSGLNNLTTLYLLGNNIAPEQFDSLQAALPGCDIYYDEAMSLSEALARKDITVEVCGNGIDETMVTVTNTSAHVISVFVPFGTYFAADDEYIQSMVVREEQNMTVAVRSSEQFFISTACMNINNGIPGNEDTLSAKTLASDSRLSKLMKVLYDNNCNYGVSQVAVWIVTDDPDDDELLNTLVNQYNAPVINENELAEAKKMVALADAK